MCTSGTTGVYFVNITWMERFRGSIRSKRLVVA